MEERKRTGPSMPTDGSERKPIEEERGRGRGEGERREREREGGERYSAKHGEVDTENYHIKNNFVTENKERKRERDDVLSWPTPSSPRMPLHFR